MISLPVALVLVAVCVLVSGFCSGTEVALFSLRRVEREQLARSERRVDRRISAVLERPRRLIATVLVGNDASNAVLAVLVLVALAPALAGRSTWLVALGALAIALPLVVLLGEVAAKTFAAKMPLAWARASVFPLSAFALIAAPVRLVVQVVAEGFLRMFGVAPRPRQARDLSEQEFRSLVDAGSAQGQVDARERRLIHRVFEFSDKNVGQVMTPRDRIFALAYDLPMQRLAKEVAARGFSRVPIYQKSLDNIRGILNAKDLVRGAAAGQAARPLGELLHEPLFVPRTTPIKRMFLTFKQKKVHMAIVVSEYGKVLGLVTMDDLLSQIFGVLRDERADLQASLPGVKIPRGRTPAVGVPASGDTGPVPRESVPLDAATGPITKVEDALDPPVRPLHATRDDQTPPAVDVELPRAREKST